MQSVLIDDRRIHVDFSQSVSKLHKDWIAKRTGGAKESMGGFDNLQKRTRYRDGENKGGEGYDLVFDTENRNDRKKLKPDDKKRDDRRGDDRRDDRREHRRDDRRRDDRRGDDRRRDDRRGDDRRRDDRRRDDRRRDDKRDSDRHRDRTR